jgi:hypothetical protein
MLLLAWATDGSAAAKRNANRMIRDLRDGMEQHLQVEPVNLAAHLLSFESGSAGLALDSTARLETSWCQVAGR